MVDMNERAVRVYNAKVGGNPLQALLKACFSTSYSQIHGKHRVGYRKDHNNQSAGAHGGKSNTANGCEI